MLTSRDMRLKVAATSDDREVRHRATTWKACLIDQDPSALRSGSKRLRDRLRSR